MKYQPYALILPQKEKLCYLYNALLSSQQQLARAECAAKLALIDKSKKTQFLYPNTTISFTSRLVMTGLNKVLMIDRYIAGFCLVLRCKNCFSHSPMLERCITSSNHPFLLISHFWSPPTHHTSTNTCKVILCMYVCTNRYHPK